MKHFKKIVGVYVDLPLPKKWGNPVAVIDHDAELFNSKLSDKIWSGFVDILRTKEHGDPKGIASVIDATTGLHSDGIGVFISDLKSESHLVRTIDWCEKMMEKVYLSLTPEQRSLAKKKTK